MGRPSKAKRKASRPSLPLDDRTDKLSPQLAHGPVTISSPHLPEVPLLAVSLKGKRQNRNKRKRLPHPPPPLPPPPTSPLLTSLSLRLVHLPNTSSHADGPGVKAFPQIQKAESGDKPASTGPPPAPLLALEVAHSDGGAHRDVDTDAEHNEQTPKASSRLLPGFSTTVIGANLLNNIVLPFSWPSSFRHLHPDDGSSDNGDWDTQTPRASLRSLSAVWSASIRPALSIEIPSPLLAPPSPPESSQPLFHYHGAPYNRKSDTDTNVQTSVAKPEPLPDWSPKGTHRIFYDIAPHESKPHAVHYVSIGTPERPSPRPQRQDSKDPIFKTAQQESNQYCSFMLPIIDLCIWGANDLPPRNLWRADWETSAFGCWPTGKSILEYTHALGVYPARAAYFCAYPKRRGKSIIDPDSPGHPSRSSYPFNYDEGTYLVIAIPEQEGGGVDDGVQLTQEHVTAALRFLEHAFKSGRHKSRVLISCPPEYQREAIALAACYPAHCMQRSIQPIFEAARSELPILKSWTDSIPKSQRDTGFLDGCLRHYNRLSLLQIL